MLFQSLQGIFLISQIEIDKYASVQLSTFPTNHSWSCSFNIRLVAVYQK